jgi:hypothetical protein
LLYISLLLFFTLNLTSCKKSGAEMDVEFAAFRLIPEQQDPCKTSTPPNDLQINLKESGIPFRIEEIKLTAEEAKNHPDACDLFGKDNVDNPREVVIYKFFTYHKYEQQAAAVLEKLMQTYEAKEKQKQVR